MAHSSTAPGTMGRESCPGSRISSLTVQSILEGKVVYYKISDDGDAPKMARYSELARLHTEIMQEIPTFQGVFPAKKLRNTCLKVIETRRVMIKEWFHACICDECVKASSAFIAFCGGAEVFAHHSTTEVLRTELKALLQSDIRDHAKMLGISDDAIEEAEKTAVIDLIIRHKDQAEGSTSVPNVATVVSPADASASLGSLPSTTSEPTPLPGVSSTASQATTVGDKFKILVEDDSPSRYGTKNLIGDVQEIATEDRNGNPGKWYKIQFPSGHAAEYRAEWVKKIEA